MKNRTKMKEPNKILAVLILIVVVLTSMTIVVSTGQNMEIQTITSGLALPSNSVNSNLNVSLSHLSYTTQPPQFLVNSSDYATNATYTAGTGAWVTNATYQIFQYNGSASATASALSYNFSTYVSSAKYFFSDSKIGLNGSMVSPGLEIAFGNQSYKADVPTAAMPSGTGGQTAANKSIAQTFFIEINSTASGSTYTYNATLAYWYLSSTGYVLNYSKMKGDTLQALNMYEVQFNIQNGTQQVSIVYTNNGTVAQDTPILTSSNATRTPMLNFNHLKFASYILTPTTSVSKSAGFLFDWMYVVDKNTNTYLSTSTTAFAPNIMSASVSGISTNLVANEPFDPTSGTGVSHYQGPNATASASQASVSNNLISTVSNVTNSTSIQNSIGLNNSQTTPYTAGMNGANVLSNTVYSNVSNATSTVDEQAQTWNSQYVRSILINFLKDYAAAQVEKKTGTFVSPNDITLVSFNIGSIFVDTNYSTAAVNAMRNYLDNTYASILAANNMSIVNPTTNAIVAGASAGDFYSYGLAISPIIHGNTIMDPMTGKSYTLSSAGFSAGAYISGGAVVVSQYKLVGWYAGSPLFAVTSGFSAGGLFTSLTSSGAAVSNMVQASSGTITNGIGTVSKVVDNNIVKPLNSGPVASVVKSDVSQLINSATGITGAVGSNVQGAFKAGNALFYGRLNSIKSNLQSYGSDTASAIMAGYHGVKTGVYSIGASVNSKLSNVGNGLNGIGNTLVNTAGKSTSVATDALSTVYTRASNYIAGSDSNIYHTVRGTANTTLAGLSAIGNTITKTASGNYNILTSTLGGIANKITGSASGFLSMFAGLPALVSHVLLYVGIGAIVIIGIILAIFFIKRKSSVGVKGSVNI